MIVLTIGSDRSLFQPSRAQKRVASYGGLFTRMFIVVFTPRGFREGAISQNVEMVPTNSSSRLRYVWDAYRKAVAIIRGLREEERRLLIISAQDPFESGLAAWLTARAFGLPLQVQIHTDFMSPWFRRESFLNRIRYYLGRCIVGRASSVRVVSERIQGSIERLTTGPVAVLPIWSNLASIRPVNDETFSVLMVTRLTREKNVSLALRAFASFLRAGGTGILTIVGDGPMKESLRKEADTLGLAESVVFTGWRDDPSSWYAKADVFLVTSNYEGWNIGAYDAARAGIPVVMTDVGLAGEVVKDGENGLVVPVGNETAIAAALLNVYRNEAHLIPREISGMSFEQYLEAYRRVMEQSMV